MLLKFLSVPSLGEANIYFKNANLKSSTVLPFTVYCWILFKINTKGASNYRNSFLFTSGKTNNCVSAVSDILRLFKCSWILLCYKQIIEKAALLGTYKKRKKIIEVLKNLWFLPMIYGTYICFTWLMPCPLV